MCTFLFPGYVNVLASDTIISEREQNAYFDEEYFTDEYVILEADTMYITKEITYIGTVVPSRTIEEIRTVNEVTYRGFLSLIQCQYQNNKTIATYKGTLYPIS